MNRSNRADSTTASASTRVTRSRRWADLLAVVLVLLYAAFFTWLAIQRHRSFDSGGFDLGVYDQVVWNTLQGRIFFYTTTGVPLLHLSNHADPILLLLAPFYLVHTGPETLILLQALVIGLGGLPLFWLGRERLESDIVGLSLLGAYLLFPALQVVTLSDFHPPALAVGFLMYAFYFLLRKKPVGVLVFAVLAMACKEQIPLIVIMMGLYALFYQRSWRLGLIVIGLAAAWFAVVMYWVIPAFSVTGGHIFLDYYADLGGTPAEIVVTAITHPGLVLRNLWQPEKLTYLRDVLLPFAGLPVVGLPATLVGAPAFAINLLSAKPAMHDATQGHYTADLAPWLAWGAFFGVSYVRAGVRRWWPGRERAPIIGVSLVMLAVSLSWQVYHGFSPLALHPPRWSVSDHDRMAQRFLDQIPADASVAAQGELYPHLSNRQFAYHLPAVNDAEYVFIDVASTTRSIHPQDLKRLVRQLLESGAYGVLDAADGYLLLQRGLADTALPHAFYDFARAAEGGPSPQYRVAVDFGDQLRLLGFDVEDDPRREETSVRLYWQVLKPPDEKVRIRPFFVDQSGRVVEDTSQRPLVAQLWYPPREWQPGEMVMTQTLPWTLGDKWSLAVGVQNGSDWSDWAQRLPITEVEAPSPLSPRPFENSTWIRLATFERKGHSVLLVTVQDEDWRPEHVVTADFGGLMALQGYSVSPAAGRAGDTLDVALFWEALTPMAVDFTVFVHLIGPEGQMAAQHDGQPRDEVPIPTSSWQEGERLRDVHQLALPAELGAGSYQLLVGAYYWETQERLPVLQDGAVTGDVFSLGAVDIR
jgi:uncharacterized membrane protein